MFDLGWSKLLILAIIAIVVVGPKELPALLRTLGRVLAELRRYANEFKSQFDEAMRDSELDQLRKDVEGIKQSTEETMRGIEAKLDQDLAETRQSVEALEAQQQPETLPEGPVPAIDALPPPEPSPGPPPEPSLAAVSVNGTGALTGERVGVVDPADEPVPERVPTRAGA